jgi:RNA polymerase sigma-54 factor
MKQSLELKFGQRLTMTPQLQQAIRLLQLSTVELQEEIQQALEENPLLEEQDDGVDEHDVHNDVDADLSPNRESDGDAIDADSESLPDTDVQVSDDAIAADNTSDVEWEDFELPYAQTRHNNEETSLEIDARSSAPTTLRDHLIWQMQMTPFSETDRTIAQAIIDSVDDDGYLTSSCDEIKHMLEDEVEVDGEEIEATLHQLQNFDPPGVCARDLKECLLLQLRQLENDSDTTIIAHRLVSDHLGLLGNRDYSQLKRLLKTDTNRLQLAIQLVQGLNPRPGSAIQPLPTKYITPDIIVKKINNVWYAELNGDALPPLRINRTYKSMIRRGDNSTDNKYIQDNLQEARWFIKSLRNRNETLLKVARVIVERQTDFFEHGEQAMKPMVLSDVAETLDMHESTISRATTHKYLLSPKGVFELKFFFSSHVNTADGGTCSSTAIRSLIKKLVETEPPTKPISDSKIAQLLDKQGIRVARRTVAKYREHMNIPPSNQRKTLS